MNWALKALRGRMGPFGLSLMPGGLRATGCYPSSPFSGSDLACPHRSLAIWAFSNHSGSTSAVRPQTQKHSRRPCSSWGCSRQPTVAWKGGIPVRQHSVRACPGKRRLRLPSPKMARQRLASHYLSRNPVLSESGSYAAIGGNSTPCLHSHSTLITLFISPFKSAEKIFLCFSLF